MWIERDISRFLRENVDPIQVIRGPRQCGKTSLVLHLDTSFEEISLDDPALRAMAQSDPELLLRQFEGKRIFIDEAQYAPELFPSLKRRVDLYKRDKTRRPETIVRVTGSNQILMDRHIKESLAGRASFFDMNTLSVHEILRARKTSTQEILYRGGWPEIHANSIDDPRRFLDSYITSYVEKDVVLAAGLQKSREFLTFIRLLAGRVGQLVDYSGLGRDTGVDSKTAKEWVAVLERMHLVALTEPFHSNLTTRLVKAPKIYFLDTGLVCRLQGWTSAFPILTSPQQGLLFENLVFSELFKLNINHRLGWKIFHWRSRDQAEIDFLIQKSAQDFLFIEAKVSAQPPPDLKLHPEVRKVFNDKIPEVVVCHQEGTRVLNNQIPIGLLADHLLKA